MAGDTHLELPDEFDALLRRALSIEPSPSSCRAFVSGWAHRLDGCVGLGVCGISATAAATVCVVAVALSVLSDTPPAPPAPQAPAQRVAPRLAAAAAPQHAAPAVPTRLRSRARSAPAPSASAPARDMPVVMVDQRHRAALTAVMRMVSEGRLTEDAFAQTTRPSMQPIRDQVAPIGVTPVQLSPIAVGGVMQSEK